MGSDVRIRALLVVVLFLLVVSCTPKERSQWQGASYSKYVGEIPNDVCVVDGKPFILGASTESEGGFVLIYVRNNGDLVAHQWLGEPVAGITLRDAGEFYWTGGACPSSP